MVSPCRAQQLCVQVTKVAARMCCAASVAVQNEFLSALEGELEGVATTWMPPVIVT